MAKKSKKSKGKSSDLNKIMGKMNEADALMQCALRSMKYRCGSRDLNEDAYSLYNEITVLEKSVKAYAKVYEQIGAYDL